MDGIVIRRLIAEVGVVLAGPERSTPVLPLYEPAAAAFRKKHQFRDIGVAASLDGDPQLWQATHGTAKVGTREHKIVNARGNARFFACSIEGQTKDALDVLQEVWSALRQIDTEVFGTIGGAEEAEVRSLGQTYFSTIAVVQLPFRAESLSPFCQFFWDRVREVVKPRVDSVNMNQFRFALDLSTSFGNGQMLQKLVVEPRANTNPADRVFFTQSPFTTEEHAKFLEDLCRRVEATASWALPVDA